jgi:hypothetical protein
VSNAKCAKWQKERGIVSIIDRGLKLVLEAALRTTTVFDADPNKEPPSSCKAQTPEELEPLELAPELEPTDAMGRSLIRHAFESMSAMGTTACTVLPECDKRALATRSEAFSSPCNCLAAKATAIMALLIVSEVDELPLRLHAFEISSAMGITA